MGWQFPVDAADRIHFSVEYGRHGRGHQNGRQRGRYLCRDLGKRNQNSHGCQPNQQGRHVHRVYHLPVGDEFVQHLHRDGPHFQAEKSLQLAGENTHGDSRRKAQGNRFGNVF